MSLIRQATSDDLARIAEIEIFNYRLNFYPIFQNDDYYFQELQVPKLMQHYAAFLENTYVYDDGAVKGFIRLDGQQVVKLFVEPVLQGRSIGAKLLAYAVEHFNANNLWALEKNTRAIAFYQRNGFHLTGERIPEDDTDEFLVRMKR